MTEENKDGEDGSPGAGGMARLAGDELNVVPDRDPRSITSECTDCGMVVARAQLASHRGSKKCREEAERRRVEAATPRSCPKCKLELTTNWSNRQKHTNAFNGNPKSKKRPASGPLESKSKGPALPQRGIGGFFASKPQAPGPAPAAGRPAAGARAEDGAGSSAADDDDQQRDDRQRDDEGRENSTDDLELQAAIDLSLAVRCRS